MIQMSAYVDRRKQLMNAVDENSIVILPAAKELYRNGDTNHPFRQNSDFYYLTGFNEPEAILVLLPGRKEGEFILFNRPRDPEKEIWDGARAGQTGAIETFLANQSFSIHEFQKKLPELLLGRETIYHTLGLNEAFDKIILETLNQIRSKNRSGLKPPTQFSDPGALIHEMRVIKSPAEIKLMQKAIDVSIDGHIAAMKITKPGKKEYELEAAFTYECQRQGARSHAYPPIIGAGKNGCVLHYVANNQTIVDGDLVLIDAGAEYENYAADLTRTFPANGVFSGEQRAIYDLVLAAQLAAIDVVKPGTLWDEPQKAILKIITQGLVDLGLLKGSVDGLIEKEAYLPFYMHKSGHWLGLDTHDTGSYRMNGAWRSFTPGMVLTVEPGIYISAHNKNVSEKWHNIGVRIEDNILVSETGAVVLSAALPKSVNDIQALMRA